MLTSLTTLDSSIYLSETKSFLKMYLGAVLQYNYKLLVSVSKLRIGKLDTYNVQVILELFFYRHINKHVNLGSLMCEMMSYTYHSSSVAHLGDP